MKTRINVDPIYASQIIVNEYRLELPAELIDRISSDAQNPVDVRTEFVLVVQDHDVKLTRGQVDQIERWTRVFL